MSLRPEDETQSPPNPADRTSQCQGPLLGTPTFLSHQVSRTLPKVPNLLRPELQSHFQASLQNRQVVSRVPALSRSFPLRFHAGSMVQPQAFLPKSQIQASDLMSISLTSMTWLHLERLRRLGSRLREQQRHLNDRVPSFQCLRQFLLEQVHRLVQAFQKRQDPSSGANICMDLVVRLELGQLRRSRPLLK